MTEFYPFLTASTRGWKGLPPIQGVGVRVEEDHVLVYALVSVVETKARTLYINLYATHTGKPKRVKVHWDSFVGGKTEARLERISS